MQLLVILFVIESNNFAPLEVCFDFFFCMKQLVNILIHLFKQIKNIVYYTLKIYTFLFLFFLTKNVPFFAVDCKFILHYLL